MARFPKRSKTSGSDHLHTKAFLFWIVGEISRYKEIGSSGQSDREKWLVIGIRQPKAA